MAYQVGKSLEQSRQEHLKYLDNKIKQQEQAYKNALISSKKIENPLLGEMSKIDELPNKIEYDINQSVNIDAIALDLFRKVANPEVTKFVMDKLTADELIYFVNNFDTILSKLKKLKALNRDVLLSTIRALAKQEGYGNIKKEGFTEKEAEKLNLIQNILEDNKKIKEKQIIQQKQLTIAEQVNILKEELAHNIGMLKDYNNNAKDGRNYAINKLGIDFKRVSKGMLEHKDYGKTTNWQVQLKYIINEILKPYYASEINRVQEMDNNANNMPSSSSSSSSSNLVTPMPNNNNNDDYYDAVDSSNLFDEEDINGEGFRRRKGKHLIKRKLIVGKGINVDDINSDNNIKKWMYVQLNNRHILDIKKLKNNILHVKYIVKNAKPVQILANKNITDDTKEIILDMVHNNKFSNKLYSLLPNDQRRLIKTFNNIVFDGIYDIQDKEDNKMMDEYNLLLGSFMAGNNNLDVINKLKKLIIFGMNEGRIQKQQGLNLLVQLSL